MTLRDKELKITDAEITEDGSIVVTFNAKTGAVEKRAVFTPEALFALVKEYGDIPPKESTDYPGVPMVTEEVIFDHEGADSEKSEEE
jgi:hypothetical protein